MKVLGVCSVILSVVIGGSQFANATSPPWCGRGNPDEICAAAEAKSLDAHMSASMKRFQMCMAGDDTGTVGWDAQNGPYLEGQGLEGRHFSLSQPGTGPLWPPTEGVELTDSNKCDDPSMRVKIKKCDPGTSEAVKCRVAVVQGHAICRQGQDDTVVIVKGYWDQAGYWKADAKTVTLSCLSTATDPDAPSHRGDGEIARCIAYFQVKPKGSNDDLTACTRLQRADYCGDGQSHTHVGTKLAAYDKNDSITAKECLEDGKCFEANWSKDGALCVAHTRWTGKDYDFDLVSCRKDFKPTKDVYDCRKAYSIKDGTYFSRTKKHDCIRETEGCGPDHTSPGCPPAPPAAVENEKCLLKSSRPEKAPGKK